MEIVNCVFDSNGPGGYPQETIGQKVRRVSAEVADLLTIYLGGTALVIWLVILLR